MTSVLNSNIKRPGRPRKKPREDLANKRKPGGKGRPPSCNWDDPAIQTLALQTYAIGLNIAEMCSLCHSSVDSFYRWIRQNNDKFLQKLDEARAKRKTHALNSAYGRAFPDAKSDKKGDTPMAMFLLRTQFGMVDPSNHTTIQIANVSNDAKPKEMQKLVERIPEMSDEELMRIAAGKSDIIEVDSSDDEE